MRCDRSLARSMSRLHDPPWLKNAVESRLWALPCAPHFRFEPRCTCSSIFSSSAFARQSNARQRSQSMLAIPHVIVRWFDWVYLHRYMRAPFLCLVSGAAVILIPSVFALSLQLVLVCWPFSDCFHAPVAVAVLRWQDADTQGRGRALALRKKAVSAVCRADYTCLPSSWSALVLCLMRLGVLLICFVQQSGSGLRLYSYASLLGDMIAR